MRLNAVQDVKVAGTVAGGTTLTSLFDIIQGGISIFAIAAGALLSVTLIIIHWQRWSQDKRAMKIRLEMDVELSRKESERYALENKVLQLELKILREK